MKRFLLFAVVATLFGACTQDIVVDVTNPIIADNTPETLVVGFEGDETRIQLNEAQKTVWTSGDLVSVFYRSDANQKWHYQGETGERVAELTRVEAGVATEAMKRVVVVYPYSENYYINTETYNVQATLPAVQNYLKDSYGLNGNIMISQGEYNNISLKSVCGWLKLQLTGNGEKVKSITLKGNNGEQVAGELYINSADATAILSSDAGNADDGETGGAGGGLVFEDAILKEVVLDCGEGVELGAEATAFYIALPPQTFANGFTVEIECEDYELMILTTEKELVIERNHIQPMASVEHDASPIVPNNQIWYTTTTNSKASIGTNANEVSHEYKDGKGVIVYDADVTTLVVHDYAVETISIPSTITKWDQLRFYGFNLKKLIGDNVSDDGRCLIVNGELLMFASKGLTEYTFPNNITKIGNESCSMAYSVSKFVIPEGVTVIGEGAFSERYDVDNSPILTVELPSTLQTIGSYAFYNAKIETINIPSSVNYIGHQAFADRNNYINLLSTTPCEIGGKICGDNSIINVPESSWKSYVYSDDWCEIAHLVRINGEVPNYDSIPCFQLWYTSTNGELVDFDISKELFGSTSIISNVYQNGRGVITCAGPIREICQAAFFYEAPLFKTITLPSSIRTIGRGAFVYHDNNLTDVYCNIATPPTGGEEMFYNNNGNIGNVITIYVPATSIDAYKNASYWKEYNIVGYNFENGVAVTPKPANNQIWYTSSDGNVVTPRSTNAFGTKIISNEYNNGMGIITFDGDVTTIGDYAFAECYSLTSVTIPDSVTEIGDYAFGWCNSLTSVNIPDSVTTIGNEAFCCCISLTSVNIPDRVTTIGEGAFGDCTSLTEFTGKFAEDNGRILVVDGVLTAFAPAGITEYNIPDSVTEIGDYAFGWCSSLTSVTIPDSVTSIGYRTFTYCTSLTSVTIGDSVTTIGKDAFQGCNSLIEFKGKFATEDGRSLIMDNTIIAYANASGTTYTIPDGVTTIGERAFADCYSLTSVTIPDSVTSIGERAFYNSYNLTSVNIPDSVTTIGNEAFCYCTSLTSVNITDSVTTIGNKAFYYCTSLKSVYCKATTPPALGDTTVFYSNGSGRKIYVPAGSVEVYKSASGWSEYASAIVGYDFETGVVVEGYGIDDSNLDHNKYLTYVANHSYLLDFESEDYYYWDTYFEHNVNGIMVAEYKFQLAATQNYTIQYISDDSIYIEGNELYVYSESYYNNYDERKRRYNTIDLTTIGIQPTDLIVLRVDAANNVVTINDQEISFNKIGAAMSSKYIFSAYDRVSDEGHAYYYDGMIDGAKLYYAKGWDSNGYLTYLGYASTDINNKTGNVEACWRAKYYNGKIVETTTFANDRYVEDYVPLGMGNM